MFTLQVVGYDNIQYSFDNMVELINFVRGYNTPNIDKMIVTVNNTPLCKLTVFYNWPSSNEVKLYWLDSYDNAGGYK